MDKQFKIPYLHVNNLMNSDNKFVEYEVSLPQILMGMYKVYGKDKNNLSTNVINLMNELERKYSPEMLSEYDDQFSVELGEDIFSLPINALIAILSVDENILYDFLKQNSSEYNKKLMYAVRAFGTAVLENDDTPFLDRFAFDDNVFERYNDICRMNIIDFENLGKLDENQNDKSKEYMINDELREAVYQDMPTNLTDLEKSIYIYGRLCQILTYSPEYMINQENEAIKANYKNIERIENVTPTDNEVVCYEFSYIFSKFLEENDINSEIEYREGEKDYGNGHAFVRFKADDIVVKADSTTSVINGDLISSKIDGSITGLEIETLVDRKKEILEDAIKKSKISLEQTANRLRTEDYIKLYDSLGDRVGDKALPKFDDYIELLNESSMLTDDLVAKMAYAIRMSRILNLDVDVNLFKQNENGVETPTIIVNNKGNYYEFNGDEDVLRIPSTSMLKRIRSGNIMPISSKDDKRFSDFRKTVESKVETIDIGG